VRVVVTGATGNVGSSLLRALSADPAVDDVVGVARRAPDTSPPGVDSGKVRWHRADVASDALEPLFEGADAVVHLAWLIQPVRDVNEMRRVNVRGSRRVIDAVVAAGVPALIHASSVGTYAAGPKDQAVTESWSPTGIDTSIYSRQKALVEKLVEDAERAHPDTRFVRMRTSLVFKAEASAEIGRLFLGPLVPRRLLRRSLLPVVPSHPRLVFQAVHADDAAEAYRLAVHGDVRGAFNVAADPVITSHELSALLSARPVPVGGRLLRGVVGATWRLRLHPTEPGWIDLAMGVPVMATDRARDELGWRPRHSAVEALGELLDGFAHGVAGPTPPLRS
jgi:UDP-glucose 4-epimerase